jgi:hypothetical protein
MEAESDIKTVGLTEPLLNRQSDRYTWFVIASGLILYLLFAGFSLNKPLVDDEADYRAAALAVAQSGKPIYYIGTTPEKYVPKHDQWIAKATPYYGFIYGLWHSPLYVYILGAAAKLLGVSNWALRIFGSISFLASWFILTRIIGLLFQDKKRVGITALFSCFYFLNPLLVQLGLLIDIDTTVVPLVSYLFVHEVIRLERNQTPLIAKSYWLAVILAVSFWAKEFAGIYLAAAWIAFNCLRLNWKEVTGAIAALLAGGAIFWATWWIFCTSTQMPLWYFFDFTGSKLQRGEGVIFSILHTVGFQGALSQIWSCFYYVIAWQSPFYLILVLLAFGSRLRNFIINRKVDPIDFLWVYIGVVFAAAQVYRPSILLRYAYPMHALALLCIAIFVYDYISRIRIFHLLLGAVISLVISFLLLTFLDDPLLSVYHRGPFSPDAWKLWLFWSVATLCSGVLSFLILGKLPLRLLTIYSLLLLMMGYQLGVDWCQLRGYVTSFSYMWYGQRGNDEMSRYLDRVLDPNEMPICRHDFGSSLNLNPNHSLRKWYTPDFINGAMSEAELVENINSPNVHHILWFNGVYRPDAMPIILNYYEPEIQVGDFVLLQRKKSAN